MNGELRLFNTYEVQAPDDLAYYILSIIKNFAIEGKIQKIQLIGLSKESDFAKRIAIYTKQLEEVNAESNWQVSNREVENSLKELNILADLTICE